MRQAKREPAAIVGMAAMLPGAPDLDTYWHNLRTGYDAITDIPADRRDPAFHAEDPPDPLPPDRTYCHRGGFLEPFTVDATALGIMPNSLGHIEPDQLLTLRVATAAVADAGGLGALGHPGRIGVILGRGGYIGPGMVRFEQRVRSVRQVIRTLSELMPSLGPEELARVRAGLLGPLGPIPPESTINLVPNLAAARVANRLDLRGPAYTVDAACASSLLAVDQAWDRLADGRCDAVLAGGVYHGHDDTFWSVFSQLRALSPSQHIRPMARNADGLLIGEGAGIIVLKRLADARRAGDRIYAVVRGLGTSSDGRTQSLFNPDIAGQVTALRNAWTEAALDPALSGSVGLLEAHSTATKAGDLTELTALAEVFGSPPGQPAVIGSVKSMIGHTMPAAGIAGLIKAALAVHHRTLLPTLHCADPNPLIHRTRFRPLAAAEPWDSGGTRRAAVNAFGFGGINAHAILEEDRKTRTATSRVVEPTHVLRLAASDPVALARLLDQPDTAVREQGNLTGSCRVGILGPTPHRLSIARRAVAKAHSSGWHGPGDVWYRPEPLLGPNTRTAFLYPGLEAEFSPNLADVAACFGEQIPETATSDVPAHQAAVTDVGLMLTRVLNRMRIRPDGLAGHSIGEWTAMRVAGMYSGERVGTQFAMPDVDYLAVGCSVATAADLIQTEPGIVVSHDNAPHQTVVCGDRKAIARLATQFHHAGIVARVLPFATGFHTPMMQPFLAPYAEAIAGADPSLATLPVWSATTAKPFPDDPDEFRALCVDHLLRPVRFREMVTDMYANGYRVFVHIGPGQLASFVTDTLNGQPHLAVSAASRLRPGMTQLRRVAIALWVAGAEPDFGALGHRPDQGVLVRVSSPSLSVDPAIRGMLDRPVSESATGLSDPIAAEFEALLSQTEQAARSVMTAAKRIRTAPASRTSLLRVSTADMPYLRDHRFFRQRDDWLDESDRRPVVPATTLIDMACRHAVESAPGTVAIGVRDVRFVRWLIADPPHDVTIRSEYGNDGDVAVSIDGFASMTVELAESYPPPPPPDPVPSGRWSPALTAEDVYGGRQMFHGPQFQGLTSVSALVHQILGEIKVLPAPGAVLDNVGQMLGCWLMRYESDGLLAFPTRIGAITFHSPPPQSGAVSCLVNVVPSETDSVQMDAQVVHQGRVWAVVRAWHDIRLECDHREHQVYAFPQSHSFAEPTADGWWRAQARWSSVAAREVFAGVYLNAAERAQYEALSPLLQREWLLTRIAAKDAVRDWLGEPLFPAEILLTGNGDRLFARGLSVRVRTDEHAVSARVERSAGQ